MVVMSPQKDKSIKDIDKVKWKELMGKDIMMKVLSQPSSKEANLENRQSRLENECNIGDAIVVDFKGYSICKDDATNKDFLSKDFATEDSQIEPFIEFKSTIVVLGDGDIPPGLEMAIRFSLKNQTSLVRCHSKFAYGAHGRLKTENIHKKQNLSVLPYTTVMFCLQCREIISSSSSNFHSFNFRIMRALAKKRFGNDIYEHEWILSESGKGNCMKKYSEARDILTTIVDELSGRNDDGENKYDKSLYQATSTLVDCHNNIAAHHLRQKEYASAKESASKALQLDPKNYKALCRAARASMYDPAGSYNHSLHFINLAEKLFKGDKEISKLKRDLLNEKNKNKRRKQEFYNNMWKKMQDKKYETNCHKSADNFAPSKFVVICGLLAVLYLILYFTH